jgi:hypothetical protein
MSIFHSYNDIIVCGISAIQISIDKIQEVNSSLRDVHLWAPPSIFNQLRDTQGTKKWSNCKISIFKNGVNYFIYKDCNNTLIDSHILTDVTINGQIYQSVKTEYLIKRIALLLLDPIVQLQDCQSMEQALVCWVLNDSFAVAQFAEESVSIIRAKLIQGSAPRFSTTICNERSAPQSGLSEILLPSVAAFENCVKWFLDLQHCSYPLRDVPFKWINRIKKIKHTRHFPSVACVIEFLDILLMIRKHLYTRTIKYSNAFMKNVTISGLKFPIKLFVSHPDRIHVPVGRTSQKTFDPPQHGSPQRRTKDPRAVALSPHNGREAPDHDVEKLPTRRISVSFTPFPGCVELRPFAVLDNLRWFFNTRFNSCETFGLDGEYGRSLLGLGQTFHKYEDMLKWLISHPHSINSAELVVLDTIPNHMFLRQK